MKQMNELLKISLTVLVLAGALLSAPAAHSQDVYACGQKDQCTINAFGSYSEVKIQATCKLNGVYSWGVLEYSVTQNGTSQVRFDSRGALVRVKNASGQLRVTVACDYRHQYDPNAIAVLTGY
ncbi:MAG: hypothetical protein V4673_13675 [Pseudomonadota bacterium]